MKNMNEAMKLLQENKRIIKESVNIGLSEEEAEEYEVYHMLVLCDKDNNEVETAYVGNDYDLDIEDYEGIDSVLEYAKNNEEIDKVYISDHGNLETVIWTREFGTSERFFSLEEADEAIKENRDDD